jgi:uncharacterized phage protein gp47/JayE
MPFPFPTLPDLRTKTRANLQANIAGADTTLRFSVLGVLSDTISGEDFAEYRSAVWLSKQLFIDSAESPYLDRRLADYGLAREGATPAAGNAIFDGTVGFVIDAGTVLETSDASEQYVTQDAGTIGSGGTVSIPILSITPGSASNAVAGALLELETAIAGVQPNAAVDSNGLTGGTDAETNPAFSARGLARIRQPPQGGCATDYLAWTKNNYAGVTRAWVYPLNRGPGTVDVFFMMDGRVNPIPLSGDISAVLTVIEGLRPVTADVEVFATTPEALDITITGMVPNTSTVQAAVNAQLAALMATIGPGGATIGDGVSAASPGGYLYLDQIEGAILAGGAVTFDLMSPSADIVYGAGQVPSLGTVTFA